MDRQQKIDGNLWVAFFIKYVLIALHIEQSMNFLKAKISNALKIVTISSFSAVFYP